MEDLFPLSSPTRNQRTLAATVAVEGFGYWSGHDIRLEFHPGEPDSGIVFVRTDLPRAPRIPALVAHRVEAPRRTALGIGDAGVEMIEHVMAALAGLEIDNCEIHADQKEMPGCDGSAQPFVRALLGAGIVEQQAARPSRVIRQVLRLGDARSWIEARPLDCDGMQLSYDLDYGADGPIGRQSFDISLTPDNFCRELAPSRTFCLKSEADQLQARGLGQRATYQDLLVFGDHGPIDNRLRYADECVRHKVLDLVGDLALAGCDLAGRFVACRSGHRLNAALVSSLLDSTEATRSWRRSA